MLAKAHASQIPFFAESGGPHRLRLIKGDLLCKGV